MRRGSYACALAWPRMCAGGFTFRGAKSRQGGMAGYGWWREDGCAGCLRRARGKCSARRAGGGRADGDNAGGGVKLADMCHMREV
jgi:hypothetical protein